MEKNNFFFLNLATYKLTFEPKALYYLALFMCRLKICKVCWLELVKSN